MLFDHLHKKVARYQQDSTIETLLKRVDERDTAACRQGDVVWHMQGSDKSPTMVILVKSIVTVYSSAYIVIATDRIDLGDQIAKAFRATGQLRQCMRYSSSFVRMGQLWTPIRGQFCGPIDTLRLIGYTKNA